MVAFSKTKRYKKTKKNRGGGSNIGSNCNDPNFSIYNTNLLKLFPYKGGKAIPPESNMELLRTPEGLEEEERQQRLEHEERQRLEDENEDFNDMDNSLNISENSYDLNDSDDIRRQNIQNDFIRGENINDDNSIHYLDDSDMSELRLSDLGGSNQKKSKKSRKSKNSRKSKKSRKGRKNKKTRGCNRIY